MREDFLFSIKNFFQKKRNLVFFLLGGALILSFFLFSFFPKEKIAFGVKIANENFGGLSYLKAKKKLEELIENYYKKEIIFHFYSISKKTSPKKLGIEFDIEETLKKAQQLGKNESFFKNLKAKALALTGKFNFPLKVKFKTGKDGVLLLEKFISENFSQFETLPQNAQIIFDKKSFKFKILPGKAGKVFNKEKIKEILEKDAQFLTTEDIFLSLEKTNPEIDEKKAISAQTFANEILDLSPFLLLIDKKIFYLERKIIASWFNFFPQKIGKSPTLKADLNQKAIEEYLSLRSKSFTVLPQNARLAYKNGKLIIISPAKEGKILDIKKSAKTIKEKILKKERKIILATKKVKPEITKETIDKLGIEKLIGKGETSFAGSPKNRIHNIKVATAKFDGLLIKPGEIFSFNKYLGNVGPEEGYLPELVIKNKKTIPEYGGGICQVSTTMFRAAVYSGMKIIERRPHAYPVRYYTPIGFDATVYLPSPDFKFKNNTPGYILIQAKIIGTKLIFEFYGKDDGRKVIVKGPYQYDIKKDGSMKAKLYQEVWKNGKLLFKDVFFSSYKSPKLYPVIRNPLE